MMMRACQCRAVGRLAGARPLVGGRAYAIDVGLIKQLRAETKSGVMACRDALETAQGDLHKAKEILLSQVRADRGDREMGEGVVGFWRDESAGRVAVAHVSCETDFVGRGESVAKLLQGALEAVAATAENGQQLLAHVRQTTESLREDATRVTGERIEVMGVARVEGPVLGAYVHSPSGFPRIATVVALDGEVNEESERAALKLAVQCCASAPASKEALLEEPFGAFGASDSTVGQVLKSRSLKLLDFARLSVGDHQ